MKRLIVLLGVLPLVACGPQVGDAPAENSPVAPEVVCEDPVSENALVMECNTAEAEVSNDMPEAEVGN